jgi:aspartate aminotransferase
MTAVVRLSDTVAAVPPSGIRAIANAAAGRRDVVHLEFGEPDFATPAAIVEAAHRAALGGATRYGPSVGLPALREAICAKLARDNGIADATPDQVIVTAGGVGALSAAYRAVLDEGSELLVPDPGWPNLSSIALLCGAAPVAYPLVQHGDHRPDLDALERLVTPRTRAIVINSPANPLGSTWPAEVLAALGEWAAGRGLVVISDECYDQLWLDAPVPTMSRCAPNASVITVFSLSKSYAMTGWRIGYAYAPADVIARMTRVQETTASCVSTPTQHAAIAALTGRQDCVAEMRAAYRTRRDSAVALAGRLGLSADRPSGAFYLWLRLPAHVTDSTRFALDLLETAGVAAAPGVAFGRGGEGHLRLSLAASETDVHRGLHAVRALLDQQPAQIVTTAAAKTARGITRSEEIR